MDLTLLRNSLIHGSPLQSVAMRFYQRAACVRVVDEIASGRKRVLLVAPTGAGKTVMFAAIAAGFHAQGNRVLVIVHRREISAQSVKKLRAAGIGEVGVCHGKKGTANEAAMVQVASIQALRPGSVGADLVIVDEAHHCPAETWARLLDLYPNAVHIGATATPWWGIGKGLGGYFQTIVSAVTMRGLMTMGHVARIRVFTHPHTLRDLDLRGIATSGDGEYSVKAVSERVDKPSLIGDIVNHWRSHGQDARTLCFAASVAHSLHIVAQFRAAGIAAEHLDGETPAAERDAILARLRSGETRIVSNFNVLTEGFDAPEVGCIILARPTRRVGVFVQTVGRGLRTMEGKRDVVILDHAGLCLRYGMPDADRAYSLDGLDEKTPEGVSRIPVRRCPMCGLTVAIGVRVCPDCAETLHRAVETEEPTGALVEAIAEGHRPRLLTINGRTMSLVEWARKTGINEVTLASRVARGHVGEALIEAPRRIAPVRMLEHDGRRQSIGAWARECGTSISAIVRRLGNGFSVADALVPAKEHDLRGGNPKTTNAKGDGFGAQLAKARVAAGLSIVALAERSGNSKSTIDNVEANRRNVSIGTVQKIAKALNVTLVASE